MATVSGADRTPDARSGGKILTKRQRRAAATPYDRPRDQQPQPPPHESPNWLTGVIFPATRMIASGAVKLISAVFDSSSSSSEDEDEDEDEEEIQTEIDVTDEGQCDQTDGVNHPNKEWMISSERRNFANKQPQLSLLNSVSKSAIVRQLMQERFSRQERDRLVKIIDSRVMDHIFAGEEDRMLVDNSVGNTRYDSTDICTEAVMEARKWLEEKKVGSSPAPDLARESHMLNTAALQHFEIVTGSPVDVAKSYIKSRPPWASPLAEHTELRTPFAPTRELFKEGTSTSFDGGLSSSSKKRNALASGSWNIEEELRRLRSKASEDMLSSLPFTNVDLSSFRTTPKSGKGAVSADLKVCEVEGLKVNMTDARPVDALGAASVGLSSIGLSDVEMRRDDLENDLENDSLQSASVHASLDEFQDVEPVKVTGEHTDYKSEASTDLDIGVEPCDDPRSSQKKVPQVEGVRESEAARNVNGNCKPDNDHSGPVGIHSETTNSIQVDDVCAFLTEASVEVPIFDETNGIAEVSQHISSMPREDLDEGISDSDKKMIEANNGTTPDQGAKKLGRQTRRGRARGKQPQ